MHRECCKEVGCRKEHRFAFSSMLRGANELCMSERWIPDLGNVATSSSLFFVIDNEFSVGRISISVWSFITQMSGQNELSGRVHCYELNIFITMCTINAYSTRLVPECVILALSIKRMKNNFRHRVSSLSMISSISPRPLWIWIRFRCLSCRSQRRWRSHWNEHWLPRKSYEIPFHFRLQ